MTPVYRLTAEERAELEAWENRQLSPEEFAQRVAWPWSEHEREDFDQLCDWLARRFPTPLERLRHARRLGEQWRRNQPR